MREFTKVSPALWNSARFKGLSDDSSRLLYVYYLTCSHQNAAGCYHLPDGYACTDLGWPVKSISDGDKTTSKRA